MTILMIHFVIQSLLTWLCITHYKNIDSYSIFWVKLRTKSGFHGSMGQKLAAKYWRSAAKQRQPLSVSLTDRYIHEFSRKMQMCDRVIIQSQFCEAMELVDTSTSTPRVFYSWEALLRKFSSSN